MAEENNFFDTIKHLPRYIKTINQDVYTLIIQKNQEDGLSDAYIVMYAKERPQSISTINYLFKAEANSIQAAIEKIELLFKQNITKGNIKSLNGSYTFYSTKHN
ncbi:MAG: hypothetical protein JXR36_08140 [Bacteroidales bacterium]|nr:hypothetical protein [Bacteroidales bacterium]